MGKHHMLNTYLDRMLNTDFDDDDCDTLTYDETVKSSGFNPSPMANHGLVAWALNPWSSLAEAPVSVPVEESAPRPSVEPVPESDESVVGEVVEVIEVTEIFSPDEIDRGVEQNLRQTFDRAHRQVAVVLNELTNPGSPIQMYHDSRPLIEVSGVPDDSPTTVIPILPRPALGPGSNTGK